MDLHTIWQFLQTGTNVLWTLVVSGAISVAVSYFFRKREARHRLEIEYEYEQRRKLRDLIGRYHGLLLSVANNLNCRLWNFYSNSSKSWLNVGGQYKRPPYYFVSFVYRFLAVSASVRQLENEAVYLDARIALKSDFGFLNYIWALGWVMTDVSLFKGLKYDPNDQKDHFFGDNFREYCDSCISEKGKFLTYHEFKQFIAKYRSLDPVVSFFDSLSSAERRFRWDRLVVFHLILMAFINSIGYDTHYTKLTQFESVVKQIKHQEIVDNLVGWLPKLGLGKDPQAKLIVKAYENVKRDRRRSA